MAFLAREVRLGSKASGFYPSVAARSALVEAYLWPQTGWFRTCRETGNRVGPHHRVVMSIDPQYSVVPGYAGTSWQSYCLYQLH
jgi:hypothetical protein